MLNDRGCGRRAWWIRPAKWSVRGASGSLERAAAYGGAHAPHPGKSHLAQTPQVQPSGGTTVLSERESVALLLRAVWRLGRGAPCPVRPLSARPTPSMTADAWQAKRSWGLRSNT